MSPELRSFDPLHRVVIYFGHQSVGGNIMTGVSEVLRSAGDTVVDVAVHPSDSSAGTGRFLHSRIGSNTDIRSKVDAFSTAMREWDAGPRPDIAFFKFCYVDMLPDSDPEAIFHYYADAMARLEHEFPDVTFVHVTMPLVADRLPVPTHAKNAAKWVLRRGIPVTRKLNSSRAEFNQVMRDAYGASGRLFDLARVQATSGDGVSVATGPQGFEALRAEYTYDGGHLNERGRRHVAIALLNFLAEVAR